MEVVSQSTVLKQIQSTSAAIQNLNDQAERCQIATVGDNEKATDLVKIIKQQSKKKEDARKALVKPLNDHVKWINETFKADTSVLSAAEQKVKGKMIVFADAQEKIRQEEQRKQEAEALEAAQDLVDAGAEESADKLMDLASKETKIDPTRGNYGSSSTRKVWTGELVDLIKVPAKYLMLDERAVKAAIANGERDIPGINIFQKTSIAVR